MYSLLLAIIYLAFISLGLPDALLGSAWPTMYIEFGVPVSYAGAVSMIIALGTVVSSLMSDRLTHALGTGRVTAISVAVTAVALLGFSWSRSFWLLCLWAVPYGIGAGCVDAALNNFVALHYKSSHVSWLHCMWGIGASTGPYVMGWALTKGQGWPMGYRYIAFLQIGLTALLFISLPMWKRARRADAAEPAGQPLPLREVVRLPGAKALMFAFLSYSAVEQTAGLWASSYLVLHCGATEADAATCASLFYVGITVGRALSGFVTMKLGDDSMIRLGQGIVLAGVVMLFALPGTAGASAALVVIGLGCAPIYPAIIHSTPEHFGAARSQAVIGVEMASAYIGSTFLPPLFGFIANHISVSLLPAYILVFLIIMTLGHEMVVRRCAAGRAD